MKDKNVGTVAKVQVSQEVNGNKYYAIYIDEKTSQSLNLKHKDLAEIKLRNQEGKTVEINRKTYRHRKDTFKVSLPTQEAGELGISEGDLLDVFISKP